MRRRPIGWDCVNRVISDEDLLGAAHDMATTISSARPVAMTLTKRGIDFGIEPSREDAKQLEQEAIEARAALLGTTQRTILSVTA